MRTMTPEQRDQFIAATQRGDQAVQEEFGWAGDAMVGMAKLGRNVMGAMLQAAMMQRRSG